MNKTIDTPSQQELDFISQSSYNVDIEKFYIAWEKLSPLKKDELDEFFLKNKDKNEVSVEESYVVVLLKNRLSPSKKEFESNLLEETMDSVLEFAKKGGLLLPSS